MTRNAQDIIDDMRNIVKPRIAKMLLEANYEGCGKEDKAEFETEFEMILTLAEMALKQESIDKSAMMYEIYMEGVNMSGEYQGCWVRFKDIEKIVDKYIAESEDKEWMQATEV